MQTPPNKCFSTKSNHDFFYRITCQFVCSSHPSTITTTTIVPPFNAMHMKGPWTIFTPQVFLPVTHLEPRWKRNTARKGGGFKGSPSWIQWIQVRDATSFDRQKSDSWSRRGGSKKTTRLYTLRITSYRCYMSHMIMQEWKNSCYFNRLIPTFQSLKQNLQLTLGNWPIIAPPQKKKKLASTTPRNKKTWWRCWGSRHFVSQTGSKTCPLSLHDWGKRKPPNFNTPSLLHLPRYNSRRPPLWQAFRKKTAAGKKWWKRSEGFKNWKINNLAFVAKYGL